MNFLGNVLSRNSNTDYLPPAYGVRREGYVLTRVCPSICLSTGGGGVRSSWGGGGQVQLPGGVGQVQWGGGGSSPAAGGGQVQPGGGSGPAVGGGGGQVKLGGGGGSAKTEQHREYLLHGGRYAPCVHAGGLSCLI